jgi:electron transfer flavoprotein alpha subunit
MTALVIAEHDNHSLKTSTSNTINAALQCDSDVHVLVVGHQVELVTKAVSHIAKVSKVLVIDDLALENVLAENLSSQVLKVAAAGSYGHILFPASSNGKNAAPRIAAKLDVAAISDITKVIDKNTFERPIYAGNAIVTIRSHSELQVITVRSTAFDLILETQAPAPIEHIPLAELSDQTEYCGSEMAKSDRPELGGAKVIVAGGRALGSKEKFDELLTPLADKLGAALAASRAAVDAGYAPNDWQVGQTGKVVAPQLYIACGISGAIQHLAGMKDSKIIVAINKDSEAPIFKVADYSLEADLFEAIPELVSKL